MAKLFKLRKPDSILAKDYMLATYWEVLVVKDGVVICKMQITRDELVRVGWADITSKESKAPKKDTKKKGGK